MKLHVIYFNEIIKQNFYKNPLYIAVGNENIEIVRILLMNDELDVNYLNIHFHEFNTIKSQIFILCLKSFIIEIHIHPF